MRVTFTGIKVPVHISQIQSKYLYIYNLNVFDFVYLFIAGIPRLTLKTYDIGYAIFMLWHLSIIKAINSIPKTLTFFIFLLFRNSNIT